MTDSIERLIGEIHGSVNRMEMKQARIEETVNAMRDGECPQGRRLEGRIIKLEACVGKGMMAAAAVVGAAVGLPKIIEWLRP